MIYKKSHFLAFFSCAVIVMTILMTLGHQINARITAQFAAEKQEARAIIAEQQRDQLERQAAAVHDRHKKLVRSLMKSPAGDSLPSRSEAKVDNDLTSQEIKIPVK